MKKAIIQFIKKINLARRFAAGGCLQLLGGLKTFAAVTPLTALFSRRCSASPEAGLAALLRAKPDPALQILLETAAATPAFPAAASPFCLLPPLSRLSGSVLLYQNSCLKDEAFYLRLGQELIRRDCPSAAPFYQHFRRRLNLFADLRLYAALLEELTACLCPSPAFCFYGVDWQKTSAGELWLNFPSPPQLAAELSLPAQQNLLRLFSYLFFRRGLFISNFSSVAVDDSHRVAWLDPDALHPVDSSLRGFISAHLANGRPPQSTNEYLLCRALNLLRRFCPDCSLAAELLAEAEAGPLFLFPAAPGFSERLEICRARNLVWSPTVPLPDPDPKPLLPLLDKNRFKKDPIFRKSSVWYYLPLLLAAYLLLRYF